MGTGGIPRATPSPSLYSYDENVNVTAHIKLTWVPAAGMNATSDPAPTSLWLIEASSADWNAQFTGANGFQTGDGSADDGIGDLTPNVTYHNGVKLGESYSDKYPASTTIPPAHWIKKPIANGTLTLDRTFKAHAAGKVGPGDGEICVGCSWGGYTITIHAQPYNFRSGSFTDANGVSHPAISIDNPNATLVLSYLWSSTDGQVSDLTTCTFNENITWNSNTVGTTGTDASGQGYYLPPSPPIGTDAKGRPLGYPNPVILGGAATAGRASDTFSPDAAYFGFYKAVSWWGDQIYVFSDTATGETNTPIPGPASGSNRITRAVAPGGDPFGSTGNLTISTRGSFAGPKFLK